MGDTFIVKMQMQTEYSQTALQSLVELKARLPFEHGQEIWFQFV